MLLLSHYGPGSTTLNRSRVRLTECPPSEHDSSPGSTWGNETLFFFFGWVCWATGPRKTPAAPAPPRPCSSPRPAAAVSSAPPPPCLGRRQPVRTRAASLSQCAPHLVGGGLKKLDPASIQLGTTASRRSLPGVPPPGSAPREGGGVGPPSLTSRHARQNARGVFPEGENRGRGARAGDRDLGTSRSPGWNASRVTPDAVNSGPPPPRRAALAPAVHPPETLQ